MGRINNLEDISKKPPAGGMKSHFTIFKVYNSGWRFPMKEFSLLNGFQQTTVMFGL